MARMSLQRRLFLGAAIWILLALATTALLLSVLFRNHLENDLVRRLDADFLQLVSRSMWMARADCCIRWP